MKLSPGLFLPLAEATQPTDSFFKRCIHENVEKRPTSIEDSKPIRARRLRDHLGRLPRGPAFLQLREWNRHPPSSLDEHCTFEAAAQERPEEPVVQRVAALLTPSRPDDSQPIMRTIPTVSISSHSFQPGQAASVAAISFVPLLYSRSVVTILIME